VQPRCTALPTFGYQVNGAQRGREAVMPIRPGALNSYLEAGLISKRAVSKSVALLTGDPGFESFSLRLRVLRSEGM
jgi:hypothetical protein